MCVCFLFRLEQEIQEVLGDRTMVTEKDLEELKYTEQVCFVVVKIFLRRVYNMMLDWRFVSSPSPSVYRHIINALTETERRRNGDGRG